MDADYMQRDGTDGSGSGAGTDFEDDRDDENMRGSGSGDGPGKTIFHFWFFLVPKLFKLIVILVTQFFVELFC